MFILERPSHEKPWGFVTVGVDMTQGKIDLRNESGRPMKVKVVGEVSEK